MVALLKRGVRAITAFIAGKSPWKVEVTARYLQTLCAITGAAQGVEGRARRLRSRPRCRGQLEACRWSVHALNEEIEKRCDYRKVGQQNDYNLGHRTSGQVDLRTLSKEAPAIPLKMAREPQDSPTLTRQHLRTPPRRWKPIARCSPSSSSSASGTENLLWPPAG